MSVEPIDPLEKAVARALAESEDSSIETREGPGQSQRITSPGPSGHQALNQGSHPSSSDNRAADSNLEYLDIDLDGLASRNIVGHLYGSVESNVFSMLRAQVLQKMQKHGCRSLAILGPSEGVGKSFVAVNLALTLAKQRNLNISLLDFDLRRPSIARLFGVERQTSVADYLFGHCSLNSVGFKTQFENLRVYAGQGASQDAAELMAGSRARRVLKELAPSPNHLVIVDLPPLCGIADVHTFLPNCDAALLVVEYAQTSKRELEESIKLIGNTPLVGSIVNRGRISNESAQGYGYGSRTLS